MADAPAEGEGGEAAAPGDENAEGGAAKRPAEDEAEVLRRTPSSDPDFETTLRFLRSLEKFVSGDQSFENLLKHLRILWQFL